ncbi:DUF5916 domain-containing protein [Thalassomonas actiniarum]|nr:DUF5916 domain-containing protein [Thalassomonas actiniarum]
MSDVKQFSRLCMLLLMLLPVGLACAREGKFIPDGRLDEALWQQAGLFGQFFITQPLTLVEAKEKTTALFYTDEAGVYIGFINEQENLTRVGRLTLYDEDISDDFNEVIIDFNGKGIRAYGFKVSRENAAQDSIWSRETQESTDWNGEWFHASYSGEHSWQSEIFIPWTSLSMDVSPKDTREIKVYFSRWQQSLTRRLAFPAIDSSQTRFLDNFAAIEVSTEDYSSLDIFPYVSMNRDLLAHQSDAELGADFFWRPSPDKQLALSLNPDFGQVESDEIVVNFSAIETYLEEKRPFFLENHAMFDVRGPENLILVNTRRVGGQAFGQENGATDIDVAARYTQFGDMFEYGILAASEDDSRNIRGRDFLSARISYLHDNYNLGLLYNLTKTPQVARKAQVWGLDFAYEINNKLQLSGVYFHSDISANGLTEDVRDNGWSFTADYQAYDFWSQHLTLYRYGRDLDINDFGFVERVNIAQIAYDSVYEWPKGYRAWGISDFILEFAMDYSENEQDDDLPMSAESTFVINTHDNEEWEFELEYREEGIDDLITFGFNPARIPASHGVKLSYKSDQSQDLILDMSVATGKSGLKGRWTTYEFEPSYRLNEYVALELELTYSKRDSWLISLYEEDEEDEIEDEPEDEGGEEEDGANVLHDYRQEELSLAFNLSARFGEKHELRLKVEGVGIKAYGLDQFAAAPDGDLNPLGQAPDDFFESEFFAQIRYRYQISPLSEIYLVYGRGGESEFARPGPSFSHLIEDAVNHPGEENIFIKARFHF